MRNWLLWLFSFLGHIDGSPVSDRDSKVASAVPTILDAAWRHFDQQWQSIDILDQKASNLLTLIAVMVTVLATLGCTADFWPHWLRIAGIGVLLASGLMSLLAYRVHNWTVMPKPLATLEYSRKPELRDPHRQTAEMMIERLDSAVVKNDLLIARKIRLLTWSQGLLIVGLVFVAGACAFR